MCWCLTCSLLWFPYLELGASRNWLRKPLAPKLGTAPHQTSCLWSAYSFGAYPYTQRTGGKSRVGGEFSTLPTRTENMSPEVVKPFMWGGKWETSYCLAFLGQRMVKDLWVFFMQDNVTFMFYLHQDFAGDFKLIQQDQRRNTIDIQQMWI